MNKTPGKNGNLLRTAGPGRKKGIPNKVTQRIRDAFALLLNNNLDEMSAWLKKIAAGNPAEAMKLVLELSERFVPKLSRAVDKEGEDIKPIDISISFIDGDKHTESV